MITIVLPRGTLTAKFMTTCAPTLIQLLQQESSYQQAAVAQRKIYRQKLSLTSSTVVTVGPSLLLSSTSSLCKNSLRSVAPFDMFSSLSESYTATIRDSTRLYLAINSCMCALVVTLEMLQSGTRACSAPV